MPPPSLDDYIRTLVRAELAAVTVPTASRYLRAVDSPLGDALVRRLVRDGVIASARPSKHLLIDRAQHDAWIAEHSRAQLPPSAPSVDADLDAEILRGVG